MKNFIKNIKKHKLIASVCFAFLIVLIVIVAVVLSNSHSGSGEDSPDEEKTPVYFEDTDYPVTVEITEEGRLTVKIDAKKPDNLKWEVTLNPGEIPLTENIYEEKGGLYIEMLPESEGYATVVFVKNHEIAGMKYEVVRVELDVFVSADDGKDMKFYFSDIRQKLSSQGAADSETPYILKENRVIFPNGGDWTLNPAEDSPEAMYYIEEGIDENGYRYFSAIKSITLDWSEEELRSAKLVLESESLQQKIYLDCFMGSDLAWFLAPLEE